MTKFDPMRPALLQISNDKRAFLIDLVAFANNFVLDKTLSAIF